MDTAREQFLRSFDLDDMSGVADAWRRYKRAAGGYIEEVGGVTWMTVDGVSESLVEVQAPRKVDNLMVFLRATPNPRLSTAKRYSSTLTAFSDTGRLDHLSQRRCRWSRVAEAPLFPWRVALWKERGLLRKIIKSSLTEERGLLRKIIKSSLTEPA